MLLLSAFDRLKGCAISGRTLTNKSKYRAQVHNLIIIILPFLAFIHTFIHLSTHSSPYCHFSSFFIFPSMYVLSLHCHDSLFFLFVLPILLSFSDCLSPCGFLSFYYSLSQWFRLSIHIIIYVSTTHLYIHSYMHLFFLTAPSTHSSIHPSLLYLHILFLICCIFS